MQKLESETLSKYFRHSRFQSLVRQLNFYNFRKVNRERTFWIYKHRLFHRDRSQDLHLLRRRTCPGVDGRKNRFSYTRREGDPEEIDENSQRKNSDDDESSLDISYNSAEEESTPEAIKLLTKKRVGMISHQPGDVKKLRRAVVTKEKPTITEEEQHIDLSMVGHNHRFHVVRDEYAEEATASSDVERDEITERRFQSHVVSQVAMKLEEYVKKAKRSVGRTRASRIGSVTPTPPLAGGIMNSTYHSRSLITYDDEYDAIDTRRGSFSSAVTVVTDGDDSMTSEEDFSTRVLCETETHVPQSKIAFSLAPVSSADMVRKVTLILAGSSGENDVATAAIAGFCMSTAPSETVDLCNKVLCLLSSCDTLVTDFQQYRSALHPVDNFSTTGLPSSTFTHGFCKHDAVSIQQIWERAGSRVDAVRDFKTFAVNKIYSGLELKRGDFGEQEELALKKTADIWLKSVVMNYKEYYLFGK